MVFPALVLHRYEYYKRLTMAFLRSDVLHPHSVEAYVDVPSVVFLHGNVLPVGGIVLDAGKDPLLLFVGEVREHYPVVLLHRLDA